MLINLTEPNLIKGLICFTTLGANAKERKNTPKISMYSPYFPPLSTHTLVVRYWNQSYFNFSLVPILKNL